MEKLIGREDEKELLEKALQSGKGELIAIYGRRRVGKTFLIRSVYEKDMLFEFSGVHNAKAKDQLQNFTLVLQSVSKSKIPLIVPDNWLFAFEQLKDYLTPIVKRKRGVVFFDEFPWIHTHKSGFLQAFDHFWNGWASRETNLVVVICGSAASWMIRNVVNSKGGLHNRLTERIRLLPFNLYETETYLNNKGVKLERYLVVQIYMAMGGVPHYLQFVQQGKSAAQNIDALCFSQNGFLRQEFKNLYQSLFDEAKDHIAVIKTLSKTAKGLSRNEIITKCNLTSGGGATTILEELEESGFIKRYLPFDKDVKDSIFKLSDEYSLFYLKFIENQKVTGAGTWIRISQSPTFISWGGFAFESICQKHVEQIKQALGIRGVLTEESTWRYLPKKGEKGAQIDLLLDRQDQCINLCEIKFSTDEYVITKSYADELQNKVSVFKRQTKTKKTVFLTMITSFGVKQNQYYTSQVQAEIQMDALFGKL